MTEFDIYTKEVEVGGKTLKLRPLDGEHLPMMWGVLTENDSAEALSEDELKDLSDEQRGALVKDMFSEKNLRIIYRLCLHTLERSYPGKEKEGLEDFVSINLMELFNVITELNMSRASGLPEKSE